jgi:hypothetical protein
MGSGCCNILVDEEVAKLLASLDEKVLEFNKTFIEEAEKCKKGLEDEIKTRHEKLEEYKKSKEGITEERLKELNKNEIEKEIDIFSNEVDKMHYIFDVGLDLVNVLKSITLNKLKKKLESAPAMTINKINDQIKEINQLGVLDFLYSTYGKVLLDAMAKKGFSETLLRGFKKEIMKNRDERRKNERLEFGIKVNEFDNENIEQLKLDLMELIKNEGKEIHKNFKGFVRDKMIEEMYKPSIKIYKS